MSNFYLCDFCRHQNVKGVNHKWTWSCDAGEVEPKVMLDYHGRGGKRYDEPTDVCDKYEPKEKS